MGNDHMAKDCRRVAFSVMLNMTPYAVQTENRHPYQLAAVISHLGNPEKDPGHYMTFLRIFGQWIRLNDTEVEAVEESVALHENFPETKGSAQTATILLYVAHN
jgi:ubiquitin C-terminal hydrolase